MLGRWLRGRRDADRARGAGRGERGRQGSAKLYRDQNVVVSRAANGTLKAYSTICTHAQCPINKLDGTTLVCPCHGSQFDAMTGKVVQSPATEPLQELKVTAANGKIVAGPAA